MTSVWMKEAIDFEVGGDVVGVTGYRESVVLDIDSREGVQKRYMGVPTRYGSYEGRRWFEASRGVGSVYGRVYGGLMTRGFVGYSDTLRDTLKTMVRDVLYAGEIGLSRSFNEDACAYELSGSIRLDVGSELLGEAVLNDVDVLNEYVRRVVMREMSDVAFFVDVSYGIDYCGNWITLTPVLVGYGLLT